MTLGAQVGVKRSLEGSEAQQHLSAPVALVNDWQTVCDDAGAADNGGSAVVQPGAITRAAQHIYDTDGQGTTLLVRLVYDAAISAVGTAPVVQIFGFDSANVPQLLGDVNGATALALTPALTTDVLSADGTVKYTATVEVDLQCNVAALVAVKTAIAKTGGTLPTVIQARVK